VVGEGVSLARCGEDVCVEACAEEKLCRNLKGRGLLFEDGRIDVLEAAYLLARCKARLDGECGWVEALRILGSVESVDLFHVYYDLRKRGRNVRRGVRRSTLLLRVSGSRTAEILVLGEGRPVTIEWLVEWSRTASGDGKDPVIAVVDGHGNVTYYHARAVTTLT